MKFQSILRTAERFIISNSPAILTAIGVGGTVTTAVLTGKATFTAAEVIRDAEAGSGLAENAVNLELKDKIKLVWKHYLPAIGVGSLTVAAIIGANRVSARRAAVIAAMLSMSEKNYEEYRDKVREKFGVNKEAQVRDEIAKDRVHNDLNRTGFLDGGVPGDGKMLIHEAYTGRFFWSSIEAVRKAQNDINYALRHEDAQTVSDFYDHLGLQHTSLSDEYGWNTGDPLELRWTTVAHPEEGMPAAHSFTYTDAEGNGGPIMRPWAAASFR